jgi:FMN phosphatase YigB (HAD superfamily)
MVGGVMKVYRDTVFFDVDDTLVKWNSALPPEKMLEIKDEEGFIGYYEVITPHVEAIKGHFEKGHEVFVWSQGGAEWAECVVKALNIDYYVTAVMDKPLAYYDDLEASWWMCNRIYHGKEPRLGSNNSKAKDKYDLD